MNNLMDGRTLSMTLRIHITPPDSEPIGETDAVFALGEKVALEAGLAAQRLAPEGASVKVDRQIVVI